MPSFLPICFLERKYQKSIFVIMENRIRLWKTSVLNSIGEPTSAGTNRVTPKINVMFTKLLPIISPNASPECPLRMDFNPIVEDFLGVKIQEYYGCTDYLLRQSSTLSYTYSRLHKKISAGNDSKSSCDG